MNHQKFDAPIHCPRDGQLMEKIHDRGQVIDQCGRCGGKWFDHGEFEAVTAATMSTPGFSPHRAQSYVQAGHHQKPYSHGHHSPLSFLFTSRSSS